MLSFTSFGERDLDVLLRGGAYVGAQIIVYGPHYVNKDLFLHKFIKYGLDHKEACIILTSSYSVPQIREQLKYLSIDSLEYEKKEQLIYIDNYSKALKTDSMMTFSDSIVYMSDLQTNVLLSVSKEIIEFLKSKYGKIRFASFLLSESITKGNTTECFDQIKKFFAAFKEHDLTGVHELTKNIAKETSEMRVLKEADIVFECKVEELKNDTIKKIRVAKDSRNRSIEGWVPYSTKDDTIVIDFRNLKDPLIFLCKLIHRLKDEFRDILSEYIANSEPNVINYDLNLTSKENYIKICKDNTKILIDHIQSSVVSLLNFLYSKITKEEKRQQFISELDQLFATHVTEVNELGIILELNETMKKYFESKYKVEYVNENEFQ